MNENGKKLCLLYHNKQQHILIYCYNIGCENSWVCESGKHSAIEITKSCSEEEE